MKIGFDAKRAFLNKSGLGNYSRDLICGVHEVDQKNELHLFTTGISSALSQKNEFHLTKDERIQVHLPENGIDKLAKAAWRRKKITKLIRREDLDVYHGLSNELPIGIENTDCKSVVTIHDLIFEEFPKQYKALDRIRYRKKVQHACTVANKVVCVSRVTARKLHKLYGVDKTKIKVIPPSIHQSFYTDAPLQDKLDVAEKYHLPTKFYLSVGNFELRKQQIKLLAILKNIPSARLVLVGGKNSYSKELASKAKQMGLSSRLRMLHQVNLAELRCLYQMATAFVYASNHEGFGMPLAEAMASNCPVIAPNLPLYHEVTGKYAWFYTPNKFSQLCTRIVNLEQDPQRDSFINLAKQTAANYQRHKVAITTQKMYHELA